MQSDEKCIESVELGRIYPLTMAVWAQADLAVAASLLENYIAGQQFMKRKQVLSIIDELIEAAGRFGVKLEIVSPV